MEEGQCLFNDQNEYIRSWRGVAAHRTWKGGLLVLSGVIPKSDHCPPFLFQKVCLQSADCYSSAVALKKMPARLNLTAWVILSTCKT